MMEMFNFNSQDKTFDAIVTSIVDSAKLVSKLRPNLLKKNSDFKTKLSLNMPWKALVSKLNSNKKALLA